MSDTPAVAPSEPVAAPPPVIAPEPAPVAAPVAPEPAPAAPPSGAPAAPESSLPSDVRDAVAAAPPAAEGAPEPASEIVPHTDTPGLLSATPKAEEPKPAETHAEPQPAAEPTEPPKPEPLKYEALTVPDGVTLNAESVAKFDELLGGNQFPAEARQALADMYLAERQRDIEAMRAEQHRVFAETRAEWRKQVMSDPDLGGSGFQTNLAAATRMLHLFVPEARRAAFDEALVTTGMADHPEFFRFMVNLARFYDEPAPAPTPQKPPPDIGRRPNGVRRAEWYDHPRSTG